MTDREKFQEVLTKEHINLDLTELAASRNEARLRAISAAKQALQTTKQDLERRRDEATDIGLKNSRAYMTLEYLDVYFATSMRADEDYRSQRRFIEDVFEHEGLKHLKLRYFDPTVSCMTPGDRINKGLLESLMLRRASVTVYSAQEEDTLGKDSELANTLAQGKPVIVYVPPGDRYERRANLFKVHPLGLQVAIDTGVAHGVIVVRSADECAQLLYDVLLNKLALESRQDEFGNFLLVEKKTSSVIRVVSGDRFLTRAFWTYFRI